MGWGRKGGGGKDGGRAEGERAYTQIKSQSLYNIRDTKEIETHHCESNESENEFIPTGGKR